MTADPSPIPRRLVYRLAAYTLVGHAARLADRVHHGGGRRGAEARRHAASKAPGRVDQAADHRASAEWLGRAASDPDQYQGPGLDAALVGYLLARLTGHAPASAEIDAELAARGLSPLPPVPLGPLWGARLVQAVLDAAPEAREK